MVRSEGHQERAKHLIGVIEIEPVAVIREEHDHRRMLALGENLLRGSCNRIVDVCHLIPDRPDNLVPIYLTSVPDATSLRKTRPTLAGFSVRAEGDWRVRGQDVGEYESRMLN